MMSSTSEKKKKKKEGQLGSVTKSINLRFPAKKTETDNDVFY